jgi:MFS family permease
MLFEKPPMLPRVIALVSSVFIAIASGYPYVFSIFAPQLVKHTGLSAQQAARLSTALSLGGSLGGLPAGITIDWLGPQWASAFGGVLCAVAYTILHKAYVDQIADVPLLMLALAIIGFSSVLSFYSTIKCTTANWPHHRGSAGAFPVASYALASMIYSYIAVRFFKDDTGGLLKFFSIFSPLVCLGCAYFLKIIDQKKTKVHRPSTSAERESLLRTPLESDASSFFNMSERRKSFQNILSLWGTARTSSTLSLDQMRPIIRPPKHLRADSDAILVAVEDTPVFVREGSPIWDHHITKAIFSRVFVKFYIILGCMMGVGQLYIYSVGYVVVVLKQYDTGSKLSVTDAQALQVSTIAFASFVGRLTSGPISDVVRRKLKAQRIWCIALAALMMALGQYLLTIVESLDGLTGPSFVIGFAFGFVFGVFPAIIADTFGTDGFTTVWGLVTTSGLLVLMQLSKILARTLKKNSDEDGICILGAACYKDTFVITQYVCLGAAVFTIFTVWYNHRVAKAAK